MQKKVLLERKKKRFFLPFYLNSKNISLGMGGGGKWEEEEEKIYSYNVPNAILKYIHM